MDLARFDLLDRVVMLDVGHDEIVCETQLPQVARLYEGHFPGYPLVPGTVQIEIMAQAAGLLSLARTRLQRMPFLIGVERARFRRELRPGAAVRAGATCAYDNGVMIVCHCRLSHDGALVAEAEIRLSQSRFPTAELEAHVAQLAARTGLSHCLEPV